MNIYKYPGKDLWPELLKRPALKKENLRPLVADIFRKVQMEGDAALKFFTETYDNIRLDNLEVSNIELQETDEMLSPKLKKAIQTAKANIEKFHSSQLHRPEKVETMPGVLCWQEPRPIEKVGLYIPGGSAPLFSTVLMLAIPAKLAGCREIVLCTPPGRDGKIDPAILYAAKLCGVHRIFKVGGAQAAAALTFGTESLPQVYKIFGPGNQFVTEAKRQATDYGVAIDLPAGPSEVLVIADSQAVPEFCAADLLSQAEHGADSQVVFVTTDEAVLDSTIEALDNQLSALPRKELAEKSIANSHFILVKSVEEALEFSNAYAPEHLIMAVKDPESFISKISNAGSVFLGNYACESAGDYASGTNHTLPTNGFARNYSGVTVGSFMKEISFQSITKQGLENIGETIEIMAEAEGLIAHKNAVSLRLKTMNNEE